ncbi:hypothetical protein P746_01368 [Enterococcus faecalis CBRD01]|nr:hypothetical protein P746_01368 [Enterococcus faecalis CBRD01]
MAKQKNFYDTYDALFQKPKWSFFPVTRTDTAKQLPNPNKKVVKPQTKKKEKTKKEQKNYLDRHCCSNWLYSIY